ncbi:histone deacetylase family protein [Nioella nitratireducens]|uniref:histone deacetylase family protein n=1 Tax=Nioella nitratireducens TaxID=1287720 RepID=UPI0008FD138E|nr:histone deacetylase family protein [Nioella nitratireducens]
MATGLITHPDCLTHVTPAHVHEQPARLARVLRAIEGLPVFHFPALMVEEDYLLRCHSPAYLARIKAAIPETGFTMMDPDTDEETFLSPTSLYALSRAAGGVKRAIDLVMEGEVDNAFAAIRPPGHHAEQELPMGFCFYGNVALGAKYAIQHHGLTRVAIVDFDVHHGNGTQALLWDEPRALLITSQQMPLWPDTGDVSETGAHNNVLNVPLAPGTGGAAMREAYESTIFPRLDAYRPELLLVSAGFDCHAADPLSDLAWVEEDYEWLTHRLCDIAERYCGGRLVSTLEGGYDLDALAASTAAHVRVLTERSG